MNAGSRKAIFRAIREAFDLRENGAQYVDYGPRSTSRTPQKPMVTPAENWRGIIEYHFSHNMVDRDMHADVNVLGGREDHM